MFNINKLMKELTVAGIPIDGCSESGRIDFKDEATNEQKAQAEQIKLAHDPTPEPTPKEQYALLKNDSDRIIFLAKHIGLN